MKRSWPSAEFISLEVKSHLYGINVAVQVCFNSELLVDTVAVLWYGRPGINYRQDRGQDILPFTIASTPTMRFHPVSCPNINGGHFSGGKAAGA
jgi:hypothetical protein